MAVAPLLVFEESAKRSTQGCRRGYSPDHYTCGICRERRKDVQKPAWALVAFLTGNPFFGFVLFALRFNVAVLAGLMMLEDRNVIFRLSLMPLRDPAGV